MGDPGDGEGRMRRLILAITGASGVILGIRALQTLRAIGGIETHLMITPSGARTIGEETDWSLDAVKGLADVVHPFRDIGSSLSSGSFRTDGMLVMPCSTRSLSGIANSYDDDLVVRAADVCLKERRRVVLVYRETPLHAGHIDLLARANRLGAVIMPPVPAYYHRPRTIDDLINQTVGRALDLFGIDSPAVHRWSGQSPPPIAESGGG